MGRHRNLATLARLQPGLAVADLGCGPGRMVRLVLESDPGVVHALDQVSDLDDDLLADPRVRSVLADLNAPIPLPDNTLDRVLSVNVLEHLHDPTAHLREMIRVLRPGGRAVVAHSDWDTALFSHDDDALTRRLIDRFVQASAPVPGHGPSDGYMGRKLLGIAGTAVQGTDAEVVGVRSWADLHRRFDDGSVAWKVAMSVLASASDDPDLAAQAAGWVEGLRRNAARDRFVFTVTDLAVVLERPIRLTED